MRCYNHVYKGNITLYNEVFISYYKIYKMSSLKKPEMHNNVNKSNNTYMVAYAKPEKVLGTLQRFLGSDKVSGYLFIFVL